MYGRALESAHFFHSDNRKTKYSTPVISELIRCKKAVEYFPEFRQEWVYNKDSLYDSDVMTKAAQKEKNARRITLNIYIRNTYKYRNNAA